MIAWMRTYSEGNGEDGVGTELALVGGAVELHHLVVDGLLLDRVHALDGRGNDGLDVLNRLQHTLAEEPGNISPFRGPENSNEMYACCEKNGFFRGSDEPGAEERARAALVLAQAQNEWKAREIPEAESGFSCCSAAR